MQELDNLFDCTLQEVPKLKILNFNIKQGKHVISIEHTGNIMNNNIQEY